MWRLLQASLVFGFLLSLAPAWGAERVLLPASGQGIDTATLRNSAAFKSLSAKAVAKGSVKVMVGLKITYASPAELTAQSLRQQDAEVTAASIAVQGRFAAAINRFPNSFRTYRNFPFIALEVTAADLARLTADPQVLSITENMPLTLKLAKSIPLIGANKAWEAGFDGAGQVVAIIDSGVDKKHPFLKDKVVSEACYSESAWCPGAMTSSTATDSGLPCGAAPAVPNSSDELGFINETCPHGTHVAGIVAGERSDGLLAGVAPGAKIISIMAVSKLATEEEAVVTTGTLLAGLQRVLELKDQFKIAAVNLSMGAELDDPSVCETIEPSITEAIRQLRAAGIATVAASGNESHTSALDWPACLPDVISVGAVADAADNNCITGLDNQTDKTYGVDKVVCYSNTSPALSLLAPGAAIDSAAASYPGEPADPAAPMGKYIAMEGTSMAAAHVSGALAIMKQKAPNAAVSHVLSTLKSSGKPITDYRVPAIVTPRIDVKAAIDALVPPPAQYGLGVVFAGAGSGSVSFSPAGTLASCSSNCTSSFDPGTTVTLTATPNANMSFAGWGNDCTGATCSLTMSQARSVTATFDAAPVVTPKVLTITKGGNGAGTITMTANRKSVTCTDSCGQDYALGTKVRMKVKADAGSVFSGWSEGCAGTKKSCTMKLSAPSKVTATFTLLPSYTITYGKLGAGNGTLQVKAGTAVSTWTADNAATYRSGTVIRLKAIPPAGKKFGGWSGVCKGTRSTCSFTLRADARVQATFN